MGRKIRLFLRQRSKIIFVFFFPPLSPPAFGISLRSQARSSLPPTSTTTPTQHNTTAPQQQHLFTEVNPTTHASKHARQAKATARRKEGRNKGVALTTTTNSMCPRPLQPAAPVTRLPAASAPTARVERMIPKSKPIMIVRPRISAQRAPSSEGAPSPASEMVTSSPAARGRVVRHHSTSYGRTPLNNYCPRACYHCRQSFVPRGFGNEFCSGECQHSFTIRRHAEQRRLHMEKHQCY